MKNLIELIKLSLACLALVILTACNGGGGGSDSSSNPNNTATSINARPVAIAGPNLTVIEDQLVTLNGNSSYDPEGSNLLYEWRQISGPATALSSESDDSPSFIAPSGENTLTFQLVTDDGTNLSIPDTITITVKAAPSDNNAGEGSDGGNGGSGGTSGGNSTDNETDNDNTDSTDNNDDSDNSNSDSGNNNSGNTGSDDTDSSDDETTTPVITNTAPTASAGDDKTINGFALVILDGSASTDPENDAITYLWQQTSGTPVSLNNDTIASPNFDAPNINDVLTFSLTVSDAELSSAPSDVSITIMKVNTAPTANAGQDKTVTGLSPTTLQGSLSSDPEGDLLTYNWTQTSGPELSLNNHQLANPSFTAPNMDATATFSLVVNDGEFNSNTDTVSILIQSINTAPTANAGLSQSAQGLDNIVLDGSASNDPENDTLSYTWTQLSGSSVNLVNPDSATPSFSAPNINDTLSFSLIVNDGELNSIADTVSVAIEKINTLPTAHAGVDRYVGSLSVVALNGTLSEDLDNDPITFTWSQLSGPSVILNDINAAKPIFTADTDGQLIFSLTVNDGQNDSEADTVKVVVGPIPATNIKVNGTGITWGGEYPTGNNAGCLGEAIDQQDCSLGRELTHNDDSDGRVGFSFTKYDRNGVDVGNNASDWQCVQDSVTGLMWEIKTGGNGVIGDEGINDADDRYSWYNSDPASNGSGAGFMDNQGEVCSDYDSEDSSTFCNTQAFVDKMNKNAWCGFADWRLPTRKELISIVDYGNARPMIDSDYFPEVGQYVWTSTPLALGSTSAWGVNFDYGNSFSIDKRNARQVRLVRGGYE